jgi:hypothetical protein
MSQYIQRDITSGITVAAPELDHIRKCMHVPLNKDTIKFPSNRCFKQLRSSMLFLLTNFHRKDNLLCGRYTVWIFDSIFMAFSVPGYHLNSYHSSSSFPPNLSSQSVVTTEFHDTFICWAARSAFCCYGNRRFVAVDTRAHCLTLFCADSNPVPIPIIHFR